MCSNSQLDNILVITRLHALSLSPYESNYIFYRKLGSLSVVALNNLLRMPRPGWIFVLPEGYGQGTTFRRRQKTIESVRFSIAAKALPCYLTYSIFTMRRSSLFTSSVQAISEPLRLQSRPSSLCLTCRLQKAKPSWRIPFSNSAIRNESIPLSERVRRKIWGTDFAPGQDDPYAKLDPEERARQEERRREAREKRAAKPEVSDDDYEPAMTWDGLETVGDDVEEDRRSMYRFRAYGRF